MCEVKWCTKYSNYHTVCNPKMHAGEEITTSYICVSLLVTNLEQYGGLVSDSWVSLHVTSHIQPISCFLYHCAVSSNYLYTWICEGISGNTYRKEWVLWFRIYGVWKLNGPLEHIRLPFWIEVFLETLPALIVILVQLLACFFTPLCDSKTQWALKHKGL